MTNFKNWRLRYKVAIPSILIAAIVAVLLGILIYKQQQVLAVSQARTTAKAIARQIAADRQIYTEKVVGKLKKDGIQFTAAAMAQLSEPGAIPLPASFVHLTSNIVNEAGLHRADLLSEWNINPDKKPRTEFEREALGYLAVNPTATRETVEGSGNDARFYLVTADRASSPACVECHNAMPQSPRRDFRLGDVMGGLVVSLPLDKAFATAKMNAIVLTGSLVGMFAVMLVIISLIQWRYVSKPLVSLEQAANRISMGELDQAVVAGTEDEVGSLAKAFERMRVSLVAAMKSMEDK